MSSPLQPPPPPEARAPGIPPRLVPVRCPGAVTLFAVLALAVSPVSAGPEPQGPLGFVVETLAEGLDAASAVVPSPDGRVLIAEQTGRVLVWKDGALLAEPLLSIEVTDYWERGLIGLALHPEFPQVPEIFVLYVSERPFVHHVLSKFTVRGDRADPGSEVILLEGDNQDEFGGFQKAGHQGGILRFGSDGMLYAGIGEQTAGDISQNLWALQGKILRVGPDGSIPRDNPFFGQSAGRYRSVFAYGVRNPFGLAWQRAEDGGRAFFTDVGGSAFEEINELVAGANYGWPAAEGASDQAEFTSPVYAYPPAVGRSVCGGTFYPGNGGALFPEPWRGRFYFADFVNGWVKALDPESPGEPATFATGFDQPVAVEVAPDGSLLVLSRGTVWRDPEKFVPESGSLVRVMYSGVVAEVPNAGGPEVPAAAMGVPGRYAGLPDSLRALPVAGLFSGEGIPDGVRAREYRLNCEPWEPGISVRRWFVLPDRAELGFRPSGEWQIPDGTVLGRTYSVSGDAGDRPVETRVIVLRSGGGFGATFRWEGEIAVRQDEPVVADLGGGRKWLFPPAEPVLGANPFGDAFTPDLNTRQLNRPADRSGNQILDWANAGLVSGVPPAGEVAEHAALVEFTDASAPIEIRVRSYLDANCSGCHRPGGASRGLFDARFETPLAEAGIIDGALAAGDLGIPGAKIVVPGDPERSVLLRRTAGRDLFRMPPIQLHSEVSPVAPLIEDWIRALGRPGEAMAR